jgi:hypothetical protein
MLTVLLSVYFIAMGIVFLALPWSSSLLESAAEWILGNRWSMVLLGLSHVVIGWGVLKIFFSKSRVQYLSMKGGLASVAIEENVIQQYLNTYLKDLFPESEIPCAISVKENQIYVTADLPKVPLEEQKQLLQKIDIDLTRLFDTYLGYKRDYTLSVSFDAS